MGENVSGSGEIEALSSGNQTLNTYRLSIAGKAQNLAALEQLLLEFKNEAKTRGFTVVITKLPPQSVGSI